jgi:4,5-DOPA dioxygenase extradiol
MTHNLHEWIAEARRRGSMEIVESEAAPYVAAFRAWVDRALRNDDRPALVRWQQDAPHVLHAHPTPEHFLPLLVAFGAAGPWPKVELIDAGVDSGVLAMDAYLFWPDTQQ